MNSPLYQRDKEIWDAIPQRVSEKKIPIETFRLVEQDGMLCIFQTKLGQNVNPRTYSGWKRKLLEWIVTRYFQRIEKEYSDECS